MDDIKFNGNKLLRIRKGKDITQEKLAELVGVSRQTIYFWESNQNIPDAEKVGKLCEVLNVDLSELVDGMTSHNDSESNQNSENVIKKTINKRKIAKIVSIIISVLLVLYIIISFIKFARLKDIVKKWDILNSADNYYISFTEVYLDEKGKLEKEAVSFEKYLKDNVMITVLKSTEMNDISGVVIDNYNTKERITINENDKTYRKSTFDIGTTSLSAHLQSTITTDTFNTKAILLASFNPFYIVKSNGSYTIEYDSLKTVMNKDTGAIFYEEYFNKNPRTQNYFKEFTIEIDTDKSFEVDLNNYTEIE